MRAFLVETLGPHREVLHLRDGVADPKLGSDDSTVVRVRAAALNFPDLLVISGGYQMKPDLPFIPGMELAGEVVEAGATSRFRVGQRVMSMGLTGAFAERAACPDATTFALPEPMSWREAAAFQMTYQTSYFALHHRAQLQPGEWLLVHGGAGGVGSAAIQLGVALGARVIATASSAAKVALCKQLGAEAAVDLSLGGFIDAVKTLTEGKGANVIFDPVGGDIFDQSTKVLAWEGRLLVIGFASGRIPTIAANRLLLKNAAVVGLQWGMYRLHDRAKVDQAQQALEALYLSGKIPPALDPHPFTLAQLPDALDLLAARRSMGKVVLDI
jgi:NADPH2:quinone reductase